MELELFRTYNPEGTNGKILPQGRRIPYGIELPWENNHAQVLCLPEGRYELEKSWSPKFLRHLRIMGVEDHDFILIHPANDAMHDLKGCMLRSIFIWPRKRKRLHPALGGIGQSKPVFLTIKKDI